MAARQGSDRDFCSLFVLMVLKTGGFLPADSHRRCPATANSCEPAVRRFDDRFDGSLMLGAHVDFRQDSEGHAADDDHSQDRSRDDEDQVEMNGIKTPEKTAPKEKETGI
ncbi:MAG: hypothetical protein P8Y58_17220 [Novosphingobium sp.]